MLPVGFGTPLFINMQLPITGQFFNTAPPRPLLGLGGIPPGPGLRMPPIRPPLHGAGLPPMSSVPRPRLQRPPAAEVAKMTLPPKTTVFVGNISEEATPDLIEKMLEECGKISEWKRMQGTNGKLQAFGFCVFEHPDATRRAIRILNGFYLGGKPLNIKIEEKVKTIIRDYEITRRQEQGLPPIVIPPGELPTSKEDCDMDILHKEKIIEMIKAVNESLLRIPEPENSPEPEETKKVSSSSSESEDDRKKRSPKRHKKRSRSISRTPKRSRTRSRSRSPSKRSRRSRDHHNHKRSHKRRTSDRESEKSDEELTKEEKRIAKEREIAYEKKLRRFDEKEVKFLREVERNKEKARRREKQYGEEARKLRIFHEDYDDDRDDSIYYTGDNYIQRRREYDKTREADLRDQEEERKELEKIKKEIKDGGVKKEVDVEMKKPKESTSKVTLKLSPSTPRTETEKPLAFKPDVMTTSGWETVESPSSSAKLSLGKKINVQKTEVKASGIFDDGNEDDDDQLAKKKIKPFEISTEERIATLTPAERKKMIKDLIETIPKTREAIFAFPIRWELLDSNLIDSRIKPWISKKITHYIGEEEPALVTFICDCIKNKTDPKKLVLDLSMVVDEEADSFITKLWRLMIYETEAKRVGLTKYTNSNQD